MSVTRDLDSRRRAGLSRSSSTGLLTGIAVALAIVTATPTIAQEADPFAGVEEMVVTGGSAASLLAGANTSAVSFDAAALDSHGIDDIGDIAAQVPNLEISTSNATNASFFIRGVGLQDFGANASSSVPIFQDGIARNASATQLVGLYDIGGLTVSKGPVGTGNFRNASAGAFIIKTNKPQPEFSGTAKVTLARINSVDARDANRYSFEAAMNAPVYEDSISLRIATRYSHENPFFENGCANRTAIADRPRLDDQPGGASGLDRIAICGETFQIQGETDRTGKSHVIPFLSKYIGEVDDFGFRASLRIQPPDSIMDWTFRAELSRLNRDSTVGQHVGIRSGEVGRADRGNYRDSDVTARFNEVFSQIRSETPRPSPRNARARAYEEIGRQIYKRPLDQRPYRGDFDRPGRTILDTHSASANGLIELDEMNVEINLGYLDYRKSEIRDTDLSSNITFPSTGSDQAYEIYGSIDLEGEEVASLPIEWKAGLYTMHEKVEGLQEQLVFQTQVRTQFQQEIYSFGIFAEGSWEIMEAFTLSGGLRYNWERKDFEVLESRRAGTDGFLTLEGGAVQKTWDAITGFGNIRYDFTEEIGTYLKYTRGFKAGHLNPSRARALQQNSLEGVLADPERIDAVEWGVDVGAWAGRATGNASLFFYNYRNYQVFRLTNEASGVFRSVESARQARNYGAEVDITVTPLEGYVPEIIEGLRINMLFGWLETNFVEFTVFESRIFDAGTFGVPINYSGNSLIQAANLSVTGTITWPLAFTRLGTITPQYDFQWTDDIPFDPNNGRGEVGPFGQSFLQNYFIGNRAYTIHNVRLTWEPPGDSNLQVAGWCRNVTDQRFKTFAVDISNFAQQALVFVGDPRTCGVDARFTF